MVQGGGGGNPPLPPSDYASGFLKFCLSPFKYSGLPINVFLSSYPRILVMVNQQTNKPAHLKKNNLKNIFGLQQQKVSKT